MIPECRHILHSGKKCRAIALRGKVFCHHHAPKRRRHAPRSYPMRQTRLLGPLPEITSHQALQQALAQTIHALANDTISVCRAQALITSLQLAAKTL